MKPTLRLRLQEKMEFDRVLLLIKKNKTFFPYYVAIEESEKANLGDKFDKVKPGKQKDVIKDIAGYHQRVCLAHPGDRGYLEIYNERLQCLKAFDLQECPRTDDEGVITLVEESSTKGRHQQLLRNNYKKLEEQINKVRRE